MLSTFKNLDLRYKVAVITFPFLILWNPWLLLSVIILGAVSGMVLKRLISVKPIDFPDVKCGMNYIKGVPSRSYRQGRISWYEFTCYIKPDKYVIDDREISMNVPDEYIIKGFEIGVVSGVVKYVHMGEQFHPIVHPNSHCLYLGPMINEIELSTGWLKVLMDEISRYDEEPISVKHLENNEWREMNQTIEQEYED